MVHYEHALNLLASAKDDLNVALVISGHSGISDRAVGFHLQQCVEKALKAVLTSRNFPFPLTHDLNMLFSLVLPDAPQFQRYSHLTELTDFAVVIRYSFETEWWEGDEEAQFLRSAADFLNSVEEHIASARRIMNQ